MDIWKYYDITHRHHVICNPISAAKLDELIGLLRLEADQRIVDVACGKGEFLIRLAARYNVEGIGIDRASFYLDEARVRHGRAGGNITFLEMDAADYVAAPESFHAASCLGASFVYGGYRPTLERLKSMVPGGGWVISGEPYWRQEPAGEYLRVLECRREDFGTHLENVRIGESVGLDLVYIIASSKDDFDRYEALQWYAADVYRRDHPDDGDLPALLGKVAAGREAYLEWGRDTLGWAIYVFRRP